MDRKTNESLYKMFDLQMWQTSAQSEWGGKKKKNVIFYYA